MKGYSQLLGIGFSLLVAGLYLLLLGFSAAVGRFIWFEVADGPTLALLGSLSMLLGVAFFKLQNKLAPEGETDGGQQQGA